MLTHHTYVIQEMADLNYSIAFAYYASLGGNIVLSKTDGGMHLIKPVMIRNWTVPTEVETVTTGILHWILVMW